MRDVIVRQAEFPQINQTAEPFQMNVVYTTMVHVQGLQMFRVSRESSFRNVPQIRVEDQYRPHRVRRLIENCL